MSDQDRIDALITRGAMLIDADDLTGWLACFADDSSYIVMPRDNHGRGLPVALMHCTTKARLRDRITCLRQANKFNPHYDRHILSRPWVRAVENGIAQVETNFMVVQTTKTGMSKLFVAGCYHDRISLAGDQAAIIERLVVLDSFAIPTMLATPL
jgi:anthranilate 1,2-dioxygenase small subunit